MKEYDILLKEGGISLERLATLCRIADAGGLSKAAGGDPSRMSLFSKQLKELASYFGIDLTRKVGRTVVLTKEALSLAATVRAQFRELSVIREQAGKAPPTLSFGASHSIFEWWLWPRLARINQALPKDTRLKLSIMRSAELARAVEENVLDAALVREDAISTRLKSTPAFEMKYSIFVPHTMRPRGKLTAKILAGLPLAISPGGQVRERLMDGASRAGVELNVMLECPTFALAAKAALPGLYATVLPDLAESSLGSQSVRKFAIPLDGLPPRKVVLAWNSSVPENRIKPIRALIKSEA